MLLLLLAFAVLLFCCIVFAPNTQAAWAPFGNSAAAEKAEVLDFIGDVYAGIAPSVVGVTAVSPKGTELQVGTGSGVIFDERGYIITNYHVIANAIELNVSFADDRNAKASVVGTDPAGDLALLQVELEDLAAAPLGESASLRVGDVVFPIGNPGGEQFARSMTMGLISGIDREMIMEDGGLSRLLQTDAAINPGNSGGPLINSRGVVIGINSAKIVDEDFENMGFAIPVDTVKAFIGSLLPEYATWNK